VANGGTVCRSGSCSTTLKCKPAGSCNADADCSGANWCNVTTHTCTPKLANGAALPTDAAHTAPVLDGKCTQAASTLVCTSAVCDAKDDKCGLADGDGPCTAATGPVLCRSGACNASGVCGPANGCVVDADCASNKWCSAGACVLKLANGTPLPASPVEVSTCSAPVGARVCQSGVCDPKDNECGYATGDGPCASASQCRSGKCDKAICIECTSDDECGAGRMCSPAGACVSRLPDGQPCATASQCLSNACTGGICGASGGNGAAAGADSGRLEGGGLSCATSGAISSSASTGALVGLGLLAAALGARRRRPAQAD
jgi:hypothetical protein